MKYPPFSLCGTDASSVPHFFSPKIPAFFLFSPPKSNLIFLLTSNLNNVIITLYTIKQGVKVMTLSTEDAKKLNLLADNAFHFEILNMPQFSFFAQTFELPGVNMGLAIQPTPLVDIQQPGDKVDFQDLTITFLVDEELENYKEIWKWIMHLGYPRNTKQYKELVESNSPYARKSDMYLNTLTNKFNISQTVKFLGCFPYALSGINFNAANTEVEHPVAQATFSYDLYYFEGDSTFTE